MKKYECGCTREHLFKIAAVTRAEIAVLETRVPVGLRELDLLYAHAWHDAQPDEQRFAPEVLEVVNLARLRYRLQDILDELDYRDEPEAA